MHTNHVTRLVTAALLALSLLALALPAASVAAADGTPRFEATKCGFKVGKGQVEGQTVTCGFVIVPEVHANPDGPTIKIAVAWFKSPSKTVAPEPIIYLEGGPGAPALDDSTAGFAAKFTEGNDFIIFDQRGVGASQPALTCKELDAVDILDSPQNALLTDAISHALAATYACRDRLAAKGITIGAYTSAESAADVNDIRAVLGYKKVKLLGISYGTRLALAVMRQFPQMVSSAVIDGVLPPQSDPYAINITGFDRSLNLMFAACAADETCNSAFPTLRADFAQVIAQLKTQPVTLTSDDSSDTYILNDWRFASLVHHWLYSSSKSRYLPLIISQLKNGDSSFLSSVASFGPVDDSTSNTGMHYSVVCSEYVPFTTREAVTNAAQSVLPEIRSTYLPTNLLPFSVCAQWPISPLNPAVHQPVTSDIPTLVMESANDPATPPSNGQSAAQTLSRAFYVESPGIGHSVIGNGGACATGIVRAFYAAPETKPDTACLATLGIKYRTSIAS